MRNPFRQRAAALAAAVAGLLISLPGTASADAISGSATGHGVPTASAPCGVDRRQDAPAQYSHVIWVLMENKSFADVNGSPNAPYINQLADECGVATNYSAETHPSLPNYVALTSGSTQGIPGDGPPATYEVDVPSIFSQLGGDWRGLDESMTSNCELTNDGHYAVRHNPAVYYTGIRDICAAKDIPFDMDTANITADLSAKFTFITPDVCDDMHSDCSGAGAGIPGELQRGDAYLSQLMPKLINSNEYQAGNTAIVLTWDEGRGAANTVFTTVVAPTVTPGTRAGDAFTHYSLLRTTEEMLGLPYLGGAADAPSMRGAFDI